MCELKYANLHTHTEYSNLRLRDSINRPEEVILESYKKGLAGVAITEHEALSSHIRVEEIYKDLVNEGKIDKSFKVVLGNEIYLIDDVETWKESGSFYHFILLAKNKKGHIALRKASNQAWENMFVKGNMERVPIEKEQLKQIMVENNGKGNVIASTACLGSEFAQRILDLLVVETLIRSIETDKLELSDLSEHEQHLMLRRHIPDLEVNKSIKWNIIDFIVASEPTEKQLKWYNEVKGHLAKSYKDSLNKTNILQLKSREKEIKIEIHNFILYCLEVFGEDDFYIEIQPSLDPEQLLYNKKAIEIADAYKLKYIATTDAHFIDEEDIVFQEAFLSAQDGDREVASFYLSCFIHTPDELIDRLGEGYLTDEEIESSMKNTLDILDKCETYSLKEDTHVPLVEVENKSKEDLSDIMNWVEKWNTEEGDSNE